MLGRVSHNDFAARWKVGILVKNNLFNQTNVDFGPLLIFCSKWSLSLPSASFIIIIFNYFKKIEDGGVGLGGGQPWASSVRTT